MIAQNTFSASGITTAAICLAWSMPASGAGTATLPAPVAVPEKAAAQGKPKDWIAEQIAGLKKLAPNWDGYGADPVSAHTLEQMQTLLKLAGVAQWRAGSIVPGADGSLQAEWHLNQISFGLLVEDDGAVSAWAHLANDPGEVVQNAFAAVEMISSLSGHYLRV